MLRLRTSWLVLGASTLISLGSNIESTSAQTSNNIYEFSIPYTVFTDIDTSFRPDLNIAKVTDRLMHNLNFVEPQYRVDSMRIQPCLV